MTFGGFVVGPFLPGWTRFLPHMRRIRAIIAEGTIGDVRSITADHRQKLPDDPKHRLNALELAQAFQMRSGRQTQRQPILCYPKQCYTSLLAGNHHTSKKLTCWGLQILCKCIRESLSDAYNTKPDAMTYSATI